MADLGYYTSSGEKITKEESEKRYPKKKRSSSSSSKEPETFSYEVTDKEGNTFTRTVTKTSGKTTISDSTGNTITDYGGGFQERTTTKTVPTDTQLSSQENPEVLKQLTQTQSKETAAVLANIQQSSQERSEVLARSRASSIPPPTISADTRTGYDKFKYTFDRKLETLKTKQEKAAAAGKTAGVAYAGLYLLGRAGKGALGVGEFVVTSPILAYELSPVTQQVRRTKNIISMGFKETAAREQAATAAGLLVAGTALKNMARDPFGTAAEFAGGAAAVKTLSLGVKGARYLTTTPVDDSGAYILTKNAKGVYTAQTPLQRVADKAANWKATDKIFRGDVSGRLRPRGRSTARGRGSKIVAKPVATAKVNGRAFRTYEQKTGRFDDYGKLERKYFTREIKRSPQYSKKSWSAGGLRITRTPYKPAPKPVQTASSRSSVTVNNNQKALVELSKRSPYQTFKNVKKLRNRPIAEIKQAPKYTYRITESGKVRTQAQQGQASVVINRQKPIRIVSDRFDTPTTPKVTGVRVRNPASKDLTVQKDNLVNNLIKRSLQRKKQLVKTPSEIIYKPAPSVSTSSSSGALVPVSPQAANKAVETVKKVSKAVTPIKKKEALTTALSALGKRFKPTYVAAPEYTRVRPASNPYADTRQTPIAGTKPASDNKLFTSANNDKAIATANKINTDKSFTTITDTNILVASSVASDTDNKFDLAIGSASDTSTDTGLASDTDTATDTITSTDTSTAQDQTITDTTISIGTGGGTGTRPASPSTPRNPFARSIPPYSPVITPPVPTTTVKPPLNKLKYPTRSWGGSGFLGQVKIKGRFTTVSVGDIKTATSEAASIVKTTPLASLRILRRDTGEVIAPESLGRQFRRSKRSAGVFVERNKFRIDTAGEIGGISRKGGKKKKKKRGLGIWSI